MKGASLSVGLRLQVRYTAALQFRPAGPASRVHARWRDARGRLERLRAGEWCPAPLDEGSRESLDDRRHLQGEVRHEGIGASEAEWRSCPTGALRVFWAGPRWRQRPARRPCRVCAYQAFGWCSRAGLSSSGRRTACRRVSGRYIPAPLRGPVGPCPTPAFVLLRLGASIALAKVAIPMNRRIP